MSTHLQAVVSAALQELGFESKPNGPPGSPTKLVVTHKTIKTLKDIEERDFEVDGEGKIKK